ncbi:hypothetical protein TR2A62_3584 [Thalassobium sp. R2A62]|nr:hypothetical protein TR2A62_3584 [Thalassobium sp. R2A62]
MGSSPEGFKNHRLLNLSKASIGATAAKAWFCPASETLLKPPLVPKNLTTDTFGLGLRVWPFSFGRVRKSCWSDDEHTAAIRVLASSFVIFTPSSHALFPQ